MKAIWNKKVIAESNETIVIEGNHYFPADSVNKDYLEDSESRTICPWKGEASYFNVVVDGKTNEDAAWYYLQPKPMAKGIKNHVAFWQGVEVVKN